MVETTIRKTSANGIPLLEMCDTPSACRPPLVIVFHGYTGRKEYCLAQAYNLATRGMYVLLPDAYGHGERNADNMVPDFFMSISRTAAEINGLIDAYSNRHDVDATRTGLVGYSMGGCIIFDYLAHESVRAAAAAPVIATPDLASIMKTPDATSLFQSLGLVGPDGMKPLIARAREVQPTRWGRAVPRVPLLIQNGEEDPLVPASGVRRFYDSIADSYPDTTRIEFVSYPGTGHADTLEMNLRIARWLTRFLTDGANSEGFSP